jgi:hypothetical protein
VYTLLVWSCEAYNIFETERMNLLVKIGLHTYIVHVQQRRVPAFYHVTVTGQRLPCGACGVPAAAAEDIEFDTSYHETPPTSDALGMLLYIPTQMPTKCMHLLYLTLGNHRSLGVHKRRVRSHCVVQLLHKSGFVKHQPLL